MAAEFNLRIVADAGQALRATEELSQRLLRLEQGSNRVRSRLKAALSLTFLTATISKIIRYSDILIDVQNRLRIITTNTEQLTRATDDLFKIATETRVSFEATGTIYSRVGLAARELGISQRELASFTKSVNKAIVLSGTNSKEAAQAMIQLSQGMASGALRGDELRSVLEQLPFVADIIAKKMGVMRGDLRELGKTGAITTFVILDAFAEFEGFIDELFAKTIPTVSQALTVFNTRILQMVRDLNEGTHAAEALARGVISLAKNIDILVRSLVLAATAFAAFKFARLIKGMSGLSGATVILTKRNALLAKRGNDVLKVEQASRLSRLKLLTIERTRLQALRATQSADMTSVGVKGRLVQINRAISKTMLQTQKQGVKLAETNFWLAASNNQLSKDFLKLALVLPFVATVLNLVQKAAKALWLILSKNPIIRLLSILALAIAALGVFANRLKLVDEQGKKTNVSLQDFVGTLFSQIKTDSIELVTKKLKELEERFPKLAGFLKTVGFVIGVVAKAIGKLTLNDYILGIARAIDWTIKWASVFILTNKQMADSVVLLVKIIKSTFIDLFNFLNKQWSDMIDGWINKLPLVTRVVLGLIKSQTELLEIDQPDFQNKTEIEAAIKAQAERHELAKKTAMEMEGQVESYVKVAIAAALLADEERRIGDEKERQRDLVTTVQLLGEKTLDGIRLENKLLGLTNRERAIQTKLIAFDVQAEKRKINPFNLQLMALRKIVEFGLRINQLRKDEGIVLERIKGPMNEYNSLLEAANRLKEKDEITTKELIDFKAKLAEELKKESAIINRTIQSLREESIILGTNNSQRALQATIISATNDKRRQEKNLKAELTLLQVKEIEQLVEGNHLQAIKNGLTDEWVGQLDRLRETREALIALGEDEVGGIENYTQALLNLEIQMLRLNQDPISGFRRGILLVRTEVDDMASTISDSVVRAFGSMEDALVDFVTTGKLNFKELASSIIQDIIRIQIQALTSQLFSSLAGGSAGGAIANLFGTAASSSARGNVFSNGNLVKFAKGGIVSGPTTFPMSGNRTGLMGEGGRPEAVIPLERMPNGDLGVATNPTSNEQPPPPVLNVKIVNVLDQSLITSAMESESGTEVILNMIQDNSTTIKTIVQG